MTETPPLELAARLEKLAKSLDRVSDNNFYTDPIRQAALYIRTKEGETTRLQRSVPTGDGATSSSSPKTDATTACAEPPR